MAMIPDPDSTPTKEQLHPAQFQDAEEEEIESSPDIVFSPPVGIQRYLRVSQVLQEGMKGALDPESPKSVLEVGCANLRLHTYLKKLHGSLQKIVYMDIDKFAMEWVSFSSECEADLFTLLSYLHPYLL
jgi:hypothetical protein